MEIEFKKQVLCGFQFLEQSPFGFFKFDDIKDKDNVFDNKVEGFEAKGKIIVNSNGFKPIKDEYGNNKSNKNIFIVTRAKSRPVLIFQDVEFCEKHHDNVFIIPIQTIDEPIRGTYTSDIQFEKEKEYFNNLKKHSNEEYSEYYNLIVDNKGNKRHRILVLNDARFVHKSSLYGVSKDINLNDEDIKTIEKRLANMINIKHLEKCDECMYNYENYINTEEKSS